MQDILRAEARRFANTCLWSWQGWTAAWASEKTLRQWTIVHALSVVLAFALDLTAAERALIVALGFLLLAAELVNTAVETVVNHLSPEHHPLAKKAKDCGSACVALAVVAAGVAWGVVLLG